MSWTQVREFVRQLRAVDPALVSTGLSPAGAREALTATLDALSDTALTEIEAQAGAAYESAVVVYARTVFTAPIEWTAVLLGRGSRVVLKHPADDPGLCPQLVEAAATVGLPLTATHERAAVADAELVVVMGADATVQAVQQRVEPGTRVLPHGHHFSVAWLTDAPLTPDPFVPTDFQDAWGGLAADAALYDGRGCLSPLCIFTSLPLPLACDRLAEAMARAESRWPRGMVGAGEHGALRSRAALAQVTGTVRTGTGWSVHGLPAAQFEPVGLPRSIAVYTVPDAATAAATLAPYARWTSTLGTDDPNAAPHWKAAGFTRICRPGRMQRPPP